MKLFIVLLGIFFVSATMSTRCISGCVCSDDTPCEYYCKNKTCRDRIELHEPCEGHDVHPRECGGSKYYDSSSMTCEHTNINGYMCAVSYACDSEYCDLELSTCQRNPDKSLKSSNRSFSVYICAPIVAVLVVTFLGILLRIYKRHTLARQATAWYPTQTPYVIGTSGHVMPFGNRAAFA
ncbi:unnamed protein product [Rotaria socialis]|uniref:Uncharacterized protein n=1 Tax=Rotaria socialis TaxID=392032 RepID=A0A818WZ67_9BILA|nr:unnamed protein product [Rotaria socialis]CAF4798262.1 unnamed protein product [Rotaria socialis]